MRPIVRRAWPTRSSPAEGGRFDQLIARHIIVHGRVQGVFYRNWTVDTARSLGVAGWVRNLPDGTVEALAEGPEDAVARLIEAMHEGPPHAAPTHVDAREVEPESLSGFVRR